MAGYSPSTSPAGRALARCIALIVLLPISASAWVLPISLWHAGKAIDPREEWLRFTLADEHGVITPGGLARALEQRKALLKKSNGRITALNAALPSSPSGWTNLTGYVHPVGRINDLLIHPTSTNTMWAGADGGGI